MNQTRIIELRQAQGWTQERLATASGVGLRTVQRLEAGQDASLETLSLVAEALQVPVRDLFTTIDNAALNSRVDSLQGRADDQQAARDRVTGAWRSLFIGIGVVATLLSFTFAQGLVLFLGYWIGGYIILIAIRRLYLEPHLEEKYPLSRPKESRRSRREKLRETAAPAAVEAIPATDQ
ncbi:helix-turn-helix transcriptional regulator [Microbacterium sp. NPDC076911]|uniref:helix-turn-helix domain-containing protein n=1 Tax=Microbacterium sp. NPDC076911 TaxID=3154958 RepID=UPI00341F4510